jgi:lipopolysaccharide transport system ATP-binding protein
MPEAVITAEGLSKRYLVAHNAGSQGHRRYLALRDVIGREIHNFTRKGLDMLRGRQVVPGNEIEEFWALKDVSFEVKQGEVIGIIGRNGAGKSTLLKILSRITEPTEGRVAIKGRVASLLEVGTGFHPELTGRENVYLNGAILGMTRAEIQRKFDEIVAFAEVEKFLDTPVKRYSSGMYVRLAFAVAAHLEPEVLIVDEVLAVGDAEFQRKCMGKMDEVSRREGRTVLFVSHNLAAVRSLCTRAIMLRDGRLAKAGEPADVVQAYLEMGVVQARIPLVDREDRTGNGTARFHSITIVNAEENKAISTGCRIRFVIEYDSPTPLRNAKFLIGIYDLQGTGIFLLDSVSYGGLPEILPATGSVTCTTAPMMATPGKCYVNVALLKDNAFEDYIQYAATFDLFEGESHGARAPPGRDWMMCMIDQQWQAGRAAGGLGSSAIESCVRQSEDTLQHETQS